MIQVPGKTPDPGFGEKYNRRTKRIINKNGSFNVVRKGAGFNVRDIYLFLINTSWFKFLLLLLTTYILVNLVFTGWYFQIGIDHLKGIKEGSNKHEFLNAFFFSVQTFTTVGYGTISPQGLPANIISSLEAMSGWLFFALVSGLLFGRFSKPTTRILFTHSAIISPAKPFPKLMFRVVNKRNNLLMELEAKVLLMVVNRSENEHNREYFGLKLTTPTLNFFTMPWTIVHEINEESPLYGKTPADLEKVDAEFLILIKGFDDTFSQEVHARYSYRFEEIVWGATFLPAYDIDDKGEVILEMKQLHKYDLTPLPENVLNRNDQE